VIKHFTCRHLTLVTSSAIRTNMTRQAVSLCLFFCLLQTSGDASPQIQLAGFDDLFAIATGKLQPDPAMLDREDRSLANTFPFNKVEQQRSYLENEIGHTSQRQLQQSPASGHYASIPQASGVSQSQTFGYSPLQSQGSSATAPASATHLGRGAAAAGFNLLAGFGTRNNPWAQYQIGQIGQGQYQLAQAQYQGQAQYPSLGQTQVQTQYEAQAQAQAKAQGQYQAQARAQAQAQAEAQARSQARAQAQAQAEAEDQAYAHAQVQYPAQPSVHVEAQPIFSPAPVATPTYGAGRQPQPAYPQPQPNVAVGGLQCPAAPGLPLGQCAGAKNTCWSVGQRDVDCPNHNLCCFDGCVNTCYGQIRAVTIPQPIRVPAVKPIRARNPAQKRRKTTNTLEKVAAAGKKCVDKIEQVEEIEYDELEECHHTYDKKCQTSYATEYESQQEEECEDNYKKSCEITYSPHAENVTVQVCMRPMVKDCNLAGPEVCRTEYVSECWTKNDPHIVDDDIPRCETIYEEKCVDTQVGYVTDTECKKWPREVCSISRERKTKYNPVTKCEKVPQQLCGPSGCGFTQGPEECYDKVKTVVTDLPEEDCDLQPRRQCSHVTKLVPKLTPVEECVDVPKEICQKTKGNPRKVLKPVTKKWCYVPSQESGLH